MTQTKVNSLGIDVDADSAGKLVRALRRLKTTVSAEHGCLYTECDSVAQVHVETTWHEYELDAWLYRVKAGSGYIGTFTRS